MKALTLAASTLALSVGTAAMADGPATNAAVLDTYADIAVANYSDSLITAQRLSAAIDTLIADPSAEALEAAKAAWLAARVPYQQTEVFRFGNAIVDDWEGIETHPETGRTKLNIPTMQSNLSYLSFDGKRLGQMQLDRAHQKNSIRHLAVSAQGDVAFAMQWQGDLTADLPLLGTHHLKTGKVEFAEQASIRNMNGYLGSVAVSKNGNHIATTSPRAGILQNFKGTELFEQTVITDACGVASSKTDFIVTSGTGVVQSRSGLSVLHDVAWDNHLIAI